MTEQNAAAPRRSKGRAPDRPVRARWRAMVEFDWKGLRPSMSAWALGVAAAVLAHSLLAEHLDHWALSLFRQLPGRDVAAHSVAIVSLDHEIFFADSDARRSLEEQLLAAGAKRIERFAIDQVEVEYRLLDPALLQAIPFLDGAALLRHGVPSLVTGRSIVLAPSLGPSLRPALLQHAAAVELQQARGLRTWPLSLQLGWFAAMSLLAVVAAMRMRFRTHPWLLLLLALLALLIAWLSLLALYRWPSPTAALLGSWVTVFAAGSAREGQRSKILQALIGDLRSMLHKRLIPMPARQQADHWAALQQMAVQVLQLERSIFLERVEGDHRVREVKAYRCSLADIGEMRRDYQRYPYDAAIRQRRPLRLGEQRPFFREPAPERVQFLVPLIFGADVLGFWAFEVAEAELEGHTEVPALAGEFAVQFAEQLFQLREHRKQDTRRERVPTLLRANERDRDELAAYALLMQRRLSLFETLLGEIGTGVAVFDCFGRPLHINAEFERALAGSEESAWELSAVDALARLTGCDLAQARREMQRVVFDHSHPEYPVRLATTDDHRTLQLRVTALQADPLLRADFPFGTIGYLLTLTDTHPRSAAGTAAQSSLGTEPSRQFDPLRGLAEVLREQDRIFAKRSIRVEWDSPRQELGAVAVPPELGDAVLVALVSLLASGLPTETKLRIIAKAHEGDAEGIDLLFSTPEVAWTSAQWDQLMQPGNGSDDRRFRALRHALAAAEEQCLALSYHSHPSVGTIIRLRFARGNSDASRQE